MTRSYRDFLIHSVHKHCVCVCHTHTSWPHTHTHTHTQTHTHAFRCACVTPVRSRGTKGRHTRVPTFSVPESWERNDRAHLWLMPQHEAPTHAHEERRRHARGHYWQEWCRFDTLWMSPGLFAHHRGSEVVGGGRLTLKQIQHYQQDKL